MALGWLGGSRSAEDPNILIARKQYGKAIDALKQQLKSDPRNVNIRQQLADVYALAGQKGDAVSLLERVADEFAKDGLVAKAIAVLKKIQRLDTSRGDIEQKLSALLAAQQLEQEKQAARRVMYASKEREREEISRKIISGEEIQIPRNGPTSSVATQEATTDSVADIEVEMEIEEPDAPARNDGGRVVSTPLFGDFTHEELSAVIKELHLRSFEPGDIVVGEGEPGGSLFIISTGRVKAFVRTSEGGYAQVREMREGDFFGEISLLSGNARSATITAAEKCELLELDMPALEAIDSSYPNVREVLRDFANERLNSAAEAVARGEREQ
jgi:hypothetical protein